MILIDFSAIMFQKIFGIFGNTASKDLIDEETNKYRIEPFESAIKKCIIENIFTFEEKFKKYGELVLCLDSHTRNWRKEFYKDYKSSRKEGREESIIPFAQIFEITNEIISQIEKNSYWKVVCVDGAEADDVILCLAELYSKTEEVIIISSDKDMIQAQKNKNVKQYSPLTKKYITPETKSDNLYDWLQEHIILGDKADEVPRITEKTEFSDAFIKFLNSKSLNYTPKQYLELPENEREFLEMDFEVLNSKGFKDIWKSIKLGPKKIQKMILNNELDKWLDSNELYRPNYERNKVLVLQEYIPTNIYNSIILKLKSQDKNNVNISNFKKYLCDCGLLDLAENIQVKYNKTISIDDFL